MPITDIVTRSRPQIPWTVAQAEGRNAALVGRKQQHGETANCIERADDRQGGSPSLTQAYKPVLALAPTQVQQENEMAVAPCWSRATAAICGRYDARRRTLKTPKARRPAAHSHSRRHHHRHLSAGQRSGAESRSRAVRAIRHQPDRRHVRGSARDGRPGRGAAAVAGRNRLDRQEQKEHQMLDFESLDLIA